MDFATLEPSIDPNEPSSPRGRSKRRRGGGSLADLFSDSAGGAGPERVRAALLLLDEVLRAVERTAWEVRGFATREAQVRRLGTTAWMLGQIAVSYRAHSFRSAFVSRRAAARALDHAHEKNARRFYETSVRHGGGFLKIGQMLSARHDLLPRAWVEQLGKLQDRVPAVPFHEVEESLEEELGSLDARFSHLDPEALAAASIGQVHRGRTLDGVEVAVKIQRPRIGEKLRMDMELLSVFLEGMSSMLPPVDYGTIRTEIFAALSRETDYVQEAQMMGRVGAFFATHPNVVVPSLVASHCSSRVLTSHFVSGVKITDALDALAAERANGDEAASARLDRILATLLEAYVRMVLEAGLFQADPHPGNLLVTPDEKVVILDFGATQELSDETRRRYLDLIRAFLFGDRDGVVSLLSQLGFRTQSGRPDTLLAYADSLLEHLRRAMLGQAFAWPTQQELLRGAASLLRQTEKDPVIAIPPEFVMIGRVFATLGGLFQHYRPRIDLTRALTSVLGA